MLIRSFIALLIIVSFSFAGTLTPGLSEYYDTHSAGESAPAIIVLASQLNSGAYESYLRSYGLPPSEIHARLLDSLKTAAEGTQPPVSRSLDILEGQGLARNVKSFWLVNAFAADVTRAGAELLANMSEVAAVGLDESLTMHGAVQTVSSGGPTQDPFERTGIREAWAYGLAGTGQVICVLGESIRSDHPALASNARSQIAPASESYFDATSPRAMQYCGDFSNRALGAACGIDSQTGDTLGAAPAAKWIAADMFVCGKSRVSKLIRSLEWAVDPDGNLATISDVPDAILNYWSVESECADALPATAYMLFDHVEALGPVMVFAVPNDASGSASMGLPESARDLIAVGNADVSGSVTVANESSAHGPSACDSRDIKPDLIAPGTSIKVASPDADSKFAMTSATAVSAGFVAGVIALIREAAPSVSAEEVKRILKHSAVDLGTPGADNLTGYGLVHAMNAIELAKRTGKSGIIQGVVRHGGEEISGARVVLSGPYGDIYATTNSVGAFVFENVPAGSKFHIGAGRFGFENYERSDSVSVESRQRLELILQMKRGFNDDCERDQGWSLGAIDDNATGGVWLRANPMPSQAAGVYVQPPNARSGSICFVTGNAASENSEAGSADVDGGRTTLRSPVFSLTDISSPSLTFSYWYSNDRGPNRGGDFFRAQISSDAGKTWKDMISTSASTDGWQSTTLNISKFARLTSTMQIQFIAEDAAPASLVEAAIDDVNIVGTPNAPEPPTDLLLDVQFDHVVLKWRVSPGCSGYRVYLFPDPNNEPSPEFLYTTTNDTTLSVPLESIQFDQFYFQVTAIR